LQTLLASAHQFQSLSSRDPLENPFYLHPNEQSRINPLSFVLTPSNFHAWECAMTLVLKSKKKLKFVDGTIMMPEPSDSSYVAWDRCNTFVLSWITHSLSPEIYNSVFWFDDCFLLWKDLKHRYHQGDIFRSTLSQEELYSIKQGDLSITTYFTKLKSVWKELESYLPIPDCACNEVCTCGLEVVREYRCKEYVIRFLHGLTDQYSGVRSQIMMMKPLPNIESTFSLLIEQERQLASPVTDVVTFFISVNPTGPGRDSFSPRGLGTRGRGGRNSSGRGSSNPNYFNKFCTHCQRREHTKDECFKLHGYPAHWNFKKNPSKTVVHHVSSGSVVEETLPVSIYAKQDETVEDKVIFTKEQQLCLLALLQ